MVAFPSVSSSSISQVTNPSEPLEIKRYAYKNPNIGLKGREEFVLFYEEDHQIKGDTYSKQRNEVIDKDITIYVTNWEGTKKNLKNLNLHVAKETLKYIKQNTTDVELNCFGNGNVSIITFV